MWDKYTQCTLRACLLWHTKIFIPAHIPNPANLPMQSLHKKMYALCVACKFNIHGIVEIMEVFGVTTNVNYFETKLFILNGIWCLISWVQHSKGQVFCSFCVFWYLVSETIKGVS